MSDGGDPLGLGGRESGQGRAVRDLYDRWARLYDWNPVLDLVRPARRRAVAALGLTPGDTAVDMGTGTGANLPYLRGAVGPDGRVVGIDLSPGMLQRARRRVERHGWDNVKLLEGDIRDPPVDGPVDAVLSAFVVVMYPDPGELIDAWAPHLETGTMANLYAGPSRRRYGPAVNALLGLYLRLFEEGWDTTSEGSRPLEVLARRGERARSAIEARADATTHDQLALGLAQLDVGRFGPAANDGAH
jgi:tRNA A58 N-methylase Trm61